MPLRAIASERSINAFECTDAEWVGIKKTYRDDGLVMPCCPSMAIPKTSKLGNYFFSHARRDGCRSAPESSEHIYLKTIIAKAAVSAGWSVFTEWRGETPDGEKWVADVFCKKGATKISLEVQTSYQTAEALKERQKIYRKSGVRAAWFAPATKFKEGYLSPSKEAPFFRFKQAAGGEEPLMESFNICLSEFVVDLLSKKIVWHFDPWIYQIHYLNDTCWKCHGQVRQVFGSSIDVYRESAKTVPNMSTVLERICELITNDELKSLGLNTIGKFERLKGNAPGFPYCNQCILCGAPQNNHYVMKKIGGEIEDGSGLGPDVPYMGLQEFVSTRDGTGFWKHEK